VIPMTICVTKYRTISLLICIHQLMRLRRAVQVIEGIARFRFLRDFDSKREPGKVVSAEVVSVWIEQRRDGKGNQADLDSFSEIEQFSQGWDSGGARLNGYGGFHGAD